MDRVISQVSAEGAITLPLTERVLVKRQADGTYQIEHAPEPPLTEYQEPATWQVFAGDELLAEWQSGSAGDALALETPQPGRSRG